MDAECAVCQDRVTAPCFVPCGNEHVFCLGCLEGVAAHSPHPRRFPCPLCRVLVRVPPGGVAAFRRTGSSTNKVERRSRFPWMLICGRRRHRRRPSRSSSFSSSSIASSSYSSFPTVGIVVDELDLRIHGLLNRHSDADSDDDNDDDDNDSDGDIYSIIETGHGEHWGLDNHGDDERDNGLEEWVLEGASGETTEPVVNAEEVVRQLAILQDIQRRRGNAGDQSEGPFLPAVVLDDEDREAGGGRHSEPHLAEENGATSWQGLEEDSHVTGFSLSTDDSVLEHIATDDEDLDMTVVMQLITDMERAESHDQRPDPDAIASGRAADIIALDARVVNVTSNGATGADVTADGDIDDADRSTERAEKKEEDTFTEVLRTEELSGVSPIAYISRAGLESGFSVRQISRQNLDWKHRDFSAAPIPRPIFTPLTGRATIERSVSTRSASQHSPAVTLSRDETREGRGEHALRRHVSEAGNVTWRRGGEGGRVLKQPTSHRSIPVKVASPSRKTQHDTSNESETKTAAQSQLPAWRKAIPPDWIKAKSLAKQTGLDRRNEQLDLDLNLGGHLATNRTGKPIPTQSQKSQNDTSRTREGQVMLLRFHSRLGSGEERWRRRGDEDPDTDAIISEDPEDWIKRIRNLKRARSAAGSTKGEKHKTGNL